LNDTDLEDWLAPSFAVVRADIKTTVKVGVGVVLVVGVVEIAFNLDVALEDGRGKGLEFLDDVIECLGGCATKESPHLLSGSSFLEVLHIQGSLFDHGDDEGGGSADVGAVTLFC
jgi:hypothetical protein